jgi:hypothetical protein
MNIAFLERAGLKFEGVSEATLAKFDAIQPDLDHLALVLRAEMPRVAKVVPVLAEVAHEIIENQKRLTQPFAAAPLPQAAPKAAPAKGKKFF